MKHRFLALMLLAALAYSGNAARADGLIVIHDGPAVPGHFRFAPLEVVFHHVTVDINGRIATTKVDQEFYNPNPQRLEGTYLFPLPEGATIDKFSMEIDGKLMDAELLDAGKARAIYEEIVRKQRDPALMEYAGRGAMKVHIFPIEPNSRKHIRLSYTQVVRGDAELLEYMYPLNTEKFSAKPLKDVSIRVTLSSNTPIRSIYSPSHDIDVRRGGEKSATIGFEAHNTRPDTDFKLLVSLQKDPIGLSLLTHRISDTEGYFMLLASPGDVEARQAIQAKDICFVLDTSGSMAGNKLEQAKKALLFCLANLNEQDRFEVVRFSTQAELLFPALTSATRDNIEKARAFVETLKPVGGTAIDDALREALRLNPAEDRPYHVIFLTDGQPTVGNTREDDIVARVATPDASKRIRIFPFGIGTDVNTTLLDRIANDTRSISQYVSPNEDIEVKVSNFYTKIQSPVMTGTKLDFGPGVHVSDLYPNAIPDLFKSETISLFGRYKLDANVTQTDIRLLGKLNGQDVSHAANVNFSAGQRLENSFIPRLWATRRIGWLLDEIRLHGDSKELKDEITMLARDNGIVTPYTAYLILEDEQRRNVPLPAQTMREMRDDREASDRSRLSFDSANGNSPRLQRAGQQAVDNATALNSLKAAENGQQSLVHAAPLAKSDAFFGGGLSGGGRGGFGYKVAENYAQQAKVVNGRAFYQNGTIWTDGTAQTKQNLQRKEIKFNSEEYFALLAAHPAAMPWFSLGEEVDVVIDDVLYVVRG